MKHVNEQFSFIENISKVRKAFITYILPEMTNCLLSCVRPIKLLYETMLH